MGDELVAEGADLAVHDETFDVEMGVTELDGVSLGAWVMSKVGSVRGDIRWSWLGNRSIRGT